MRNHYNVVNNNNNKGRRQNMDEINRTIIDTNGSWGGNAWDAGLGGSTDSSNH